MSLITLALLLLLVGYSAGIIGSLTGLGGGLIVIPALVLLFHLDIHYAMGASLVSVLATSSGASIAYMQEGYANIRIGMFLETAVVVGAMTGALLAPYAPGHYISILFGLVLMVSAYFMIQRKAEVVTATHPGVWVNTLKLKGTYPTPSGKLAYQAQRAPLAWCLMIMAGGLSGLLGIGSGAFKVLAMDQAMRLPYKVSTTTSNFMIGITAAVSAGIYFSHGYINPIITFPVMLGVFAGAFTGARVMPKIQSQSLRKIFMWVLLALALQMIYKGLTGKL